MSPETLEDVSGPSWVVLDGILGETGVSDLRVESALASVEDVPVVSAVDWESRNDWEVSGVLALDEWRFDR